MANGYVKLLELGGIELSIHGRKFEEKRDERSTEVQLANGRTKKYIKYIGKEWTLSWTWLPNDTTTVDSAAGRDGIKALTTDGAKKTLTIYPLSGSSSSFDVFVVEYSEELLRREAITGKTYWNINMTVRET